MADIPALDFWNLVTEVFHYFQNQSNKTNRFMGTEETCCVPHHIEQAHPELNQSFNKATTVLICFTLTVCLSNAKFSQSNAIEKDDDQRPKSHNETYVSRTHRVALDWLFDRINLDSEFKFDTLIPNINSQTC